MPKYRHETLVTSIIQKPISTIEPTVIQLRRLNNFQSQKIV